VIAVIAPWTPSDEPSPAEIARAQARLGDGVSRVLVLGDSVAHGAGDETGVGIAGYLCEEIRHQTASPLIPTNLGLNGARTATVAALLKRQDARAKVAAADLIVISIGGNDLYGDSAAQILSRLLPSVQRLRTNLAVARLVESVQKMNPAARIYMLGLYNPYPKSSHASWLDTQVNLWDGNLIRRLAGKNRVTVLRIADLLARPDRISPVDHFHPGSRGYRAIARRIAETL
jgi:lysophospholipase L1-like esterase